VRSEATAVPQPPPFDLKDVHDRGERWQAALTEAPQQVPKGQGVAGKRPAVSGGFGQPGLPEEIICPTRARPVRPGLMRLSLLNIATFWTQP